MNSRDRALSDAELKSFWQEFGNAGLAGMALRVLLLTGQRPGEVAKNASRSHPGRLVVPCPEHRSPRWAGWGSKNAQTHRIWLSQPVRDIIAELNDGAYDRLHLREAATAGFYDACYLSTAWRSSRLASA